jgi:hypothetical protein
MRGTAATRAMTPTPATETTRAMETTGTPEGHGGHDHGHGTSNFAFEVTDVVARPAGAGRLGPRHRAADVRGARRGAARPRPAAAPPLPAAAAPENDAPHLVVQRVSIKTI